MNFICVKDYNGKDLTSKEIEIFLGERLEARKGFIYYNSHPFCSVRSSVSKTYFIWDDHFERRAQYLSLILDENRKRTWAENTSIVDDKGKIISTIPQQKAGRYSPSEIKYIRKNFPKMVNFEGPLNFSDYFYIESNIDELESLYNYCKDIH